MRWIGLLLALALIVACGDLATPQPAPEPTVVERLHVEASSSPGFPSKRSFDQHYEKHGAEFGAITQAEYLALAQQLRDKAVGGAVLETVREDGVITRFDRETGSFGAYNPDRTIRTFFIPNDGERYFQRQARKERRE